MEATRICFLVRLGRRRAKRRQQKENSCCDEPFPGDRVARVAVSGDVEPCEARAARVIRRAQYKILDTVVVEINYKGTPACVA